MSGQVQGAHCNIYLVKVKTTRDIFSSERCKLLLVLSIYTSKHYLQIAQSCFKKVDIHVSSMHSNS